MSVPESRYCGSDGPQGAKIAIVGEAPGFQEARHGKPFVGKSGQLLEQTLGHYDIKREEVYLTNAVLCRPDENGTPHKDAVKACATRLHAELQALPELETVVTLGNTASQELLGTTEGITTLRAGPPKEHAFYGWQVIPTVHPAFCLRNGDAFPSLVADLGKINNELPAWTEPDYVVYDDPKQAALFLLQLTRSEHTEIVIDIEVGVDKHDMGHADQYDMLCIGFCYKDNVAVVVGENALQDTYVQHRLRELLESDKKWICHNGKFDLAGLWDRWGKTNLYFDTMLASYALDERQGVHRLEYVAGEILGSPNWKHVIDKYKGKDETYAVIPRDVLYKYNAFDVVNTFRLFKYFEAKLEEEGLRELHDFLCRASDALMHSEMEGIAIDISQLDTLTEKYLATLGNLEQELSEITSTPTFNPRSWKQVKDYLWAHNAKVPATDADTLTLLRERTKDTDEIAPFLDTLLIHRKEQKQYGTYVKGVRKRLHRGRIHSSFLLHGTTTGRLSSRNPNLQNVPRPSTPAGRSLRAQFVPSPGNVFVQADYGQIELRVAAILSGDEYLIGVFNDPSRDIFDEVGTALYGPDATGPNRKELRIRTKAYVYGVNYGREAFSIAEEFRISVQEAQRGMDAFFEQVPQLVQWREDTKYQILTGSDDLVTPFGRHRRFWLINDENKMDVIKEGLAFKPQSTASDVTLTALCKLREEGLHVRIPVHDSILVECAREETDAVASRMVAVMEATATECLGDLVPFVAEWETGDHWGEV